jgi:glycosyltransferase involved in cell wall biosynthesis
MRFHVVAMPHTQTHAKHEACAFTAKIFKFCRMMTSLGHEVLHYGAEGSELDCTEHIDIITAEEQLKYFGEFDINKLYSVDWSGAAEYWKLTNDRAIAAINSRKQKGDFVCIVCGALNKSIVDATADGTIAVEPFIGYNGPYLPFRVYESYSHMHRIWGQQNPHADFDGKFYEAVIPNYWDHTKFPLQVEKSDYFMYLGRIVHRKGVRIAVDTCREIGARLVLAGQGITRREGNKYYTEDNQIYEGDHIDWVGPVIGEQKVKLLGSARAVFCPTTYVEPFGGVACEAMLCGTPVITTNFGAWTETVEHGKTGYRCHTLDHFIWAAKNTHLLAHPTYIKKRADRLWSMDNVRFMFDEYFHMLSDLWGPGWPTKHPERMHLNWLNGF